MTTIQALFDFLIAVFRTRLSLHLEILALRQQLAVYQRSYPLVLALTSLVRLAGDSGFVQTETVIGWRRRRFREQTAMLLTLRSWTITEVCYGSEA
ncbi:MAG: hypothetical protein ACYC9L_16400 [Sulfuricaulis sp.]